MDESGDTSLQTALRDFRHGQIAAYDYRQVWPPLDEPHRGSVPVLPMGVSQEVYTYAFNTIDLANFEEELIEMRRRRATGKMDPKMSKLRDGWYWTAPWWSMFVPATVFILHMFHYWISPLFRAREVHHWGNPTNHNGSAPAS